MTITDGMLKEAKEAFKKCGPHALLDDALREVVKVVRAAALECAADLADDWSPAYAKFDDMITAAAIKEVGEIQSDIAAAIRDLIDKEISK